MNLEYLYLSNFRNYIQREWYFSSKHNIILGRNGSGKTNLIESIYYLSFSKSFRNNSDYSLINNNSNFFFIKGIYNNQTKNSIEISYFLNKGKKVRFNNNRIKTKELLSKFRSVVFDSEDIFLVKGTSSLRRKYMDVILSQTNRNYLNNLISYNKILKQKNMILKKKNYELIDIINIQLADYGSKIINERIKFLNFIKPIFFNIFSYITQKKINIDFVYKTKIKDEINKDNFLYFLNKYKEKEFLNGYAIIGPHRDDIEFLSDNYSFKDIASLGQIRIIGIVLKLLYVEYIKMNTNDIPVVLLDDVLLELDSVHIKNIINFFNKYDDIQTFECTTNLSLFKNLKDYNIIKIDDE